MKGVKVHHLYPQVEVPEIHPGEIQFGAGSFLSEIPFGESVVAMDNDQHEYVYDPDHLVDGDRYYKVLKKDYTGSIKAAWQVHSEY